MILHIVECEMCQNHYRINPMQRPQHCEAPDGWLILFQAKDMQAQEGWHFCSKSCLMEWIRTADARTRGNP